MYIHACTAKYQTEYLANSRCGAICASNLVVEEDPHDGRHHAHDVGEGDGVTEHEQRDANDHDPLGCISHGVAQWAHQVQHAEGDHVLSKVTEAADQQQEECPSPARHVRL